MAQIPTFPAGGDSVGFLPRLDQRSQPSPPVAILSDFFLGWTSDLAGEIGIPRLVFSPSGAFAQSFSFWLWRNLPELDVGSRDLSSVIEMPELPNSPSYPWWQVPYHYRNFVSGDPNWEFHRNGFLANMASWGVVFNSFRDLEADYLAHVKKVLGHNRVWAVGPLLPKKDDLVDRGGNSSVPAHEVLTWLDRHPDQSVVYICFGSRTVLTSKQMDELAAALEASGVRFVWCVGQPREGQVVRDQGTIPEGFEDRVANRGFVIKGWAPQVSILRHRAVGAFLTHCGWNSTLEGLEAGVVMLAWPMDADQFTNAKLLVDQLRVGIRVGEGNKNIPKASKLANILAESINGCEREKLRAKELSKAASDAVNNGSSHQDLLDLVKCLWKLKNQ